MSTKNDIEKLFQDQLGDYQLKPSAESWVKLSKKLRWKNFMRPRWNSFNIAYLGGTVLVTAIAVFSIANNSNFISDQKTDLELIDNNSGFEINNRNSISPDDKVLDNSNSTGKNTNSSTASQLSNIQKDKEQNSDSEHGENIALSNQANSGEENILEETENQNTATMMQMPPRAFFTSSIKEGCAPFQIEFINLSTEASTYSWSFGDGGISTETNPGYIFDEPGEYFVSLTAKNSNDEISIHRELIKVNSVPDIQFSIDKTASNTNEYPVYFYNYTKGAETYSWNFGDGNVSKATDPMHIYSTSGEYNVELIATSAEGCKDSLVLKNILQNDISVVKIPNAFCPNPSGPNGGYYSNGENNNEVFHPYLEEIPVEYKLRVFNRKGNLLFESNDINIGWDGYYMQKLQPRGVYIYKLRVKFENGESIVKMGDVTLFMK